MGTHQGDDAQPMEEPKQPIGSSYIPPINYEASIQTLHRQLDKHDRRMNRQFDALAQRVDVMMEFNARFSLTLSQIFSIRSSFGPVQFLVYANVLAYPPADSPDDDDDDDRSSSQGSPQF